MHLRRNVGAGQGRRSQSPGTRYCRVILSIYAELDFSNGFLRMSYFKASKILINLISLFLIPCSPSNRQLMKLNQKDLKYLWSLWQWFLEVNYYSQIWLSFSFSFFFFKFPCSLNILTEFVYKYAGIAVSVYVSFFTLSLVILQFLIYISYFGYCI